MKEAEIKTVLMLLGFKENATDIATWSMRRGNKGVRYYKRGEEFMYNSNYKDPSTTYTRKTIHLLLERLK